MKNQKIIEKFSDDEAGEIFKEFAWSLAAMIHRKKPVQKIKRRVEKTPAHQTNSSVEKTGAFHQC